MGQSRTRLKLGGVSIFGRHTDIPQLLRRCLPALERNGDVVQLASYAPALARQGHTQWMTDLIYFDKTAIETMAKNYVPPAQ